MQVMSIGNAAAEIDAPTSAATAPEAVGGFASMLAMLMSAEGMGDAAPTVNAEAAEAEPADSAEETPSDASTESEGSLGVLAAALTAQVPAPAATAGAKDLSPTPTTSVTIEPPEASASTGTTSPQAAPSAADVERVPMAEALVPAASVNVRSQANHTVAPHPASAAAEVTPTPVAPAPLVPPGSTQSQGTALTAAAAEAAPVTATLAAAPQTLARATVSTASVLGRDSVTVDEADSDTEAPANVARAATANAVATADDAETLEPPAPAPVLERNTVVLARNALNEQVRESSSRELLASARDPEPRSEKPTDASPPPLLTGTEAVARSLPRHASAATHVAGGHAQAEVTTTLPTLGEDLVKHVSLSSGPGERTLSLRLHPESLGEVRIEVRSTASEVSVRIVSQDASVREALEHHAAGLREALSKDGRETRIEIGSQLMSNMGNSSDSTWGQRNATPQDLQDRPRFTAQLNYGASTPEPVAQAERRAPQHTGVLNLFA